MANQYERRSNAIDTLVTTSISQQLDKEITSALKACLHITKQKLLHHAKDLQAANAKLEVTDKKPNKLSFSNFFHRNKIAAEPLKPLTPKQATELDIAISIVKNIEEYITQQNSIEKMMMAIANVTRKPDDVIVSVTGNDKDENSSLYVTLRKLKDSNALTDKTIPKILKNLTSNLQGYEDSIKYLVEQHLNKATQIIKNEIKDTYSKNTYISLVQEEYETKEMFVLTQLSEARFNGLLASLEIKLNSSHAQKTQHKAEEKQAQGPRKAW